MMSPGGRSIRILIDAALNTPGVVDDPRPVSCWRTSLSDWYPVYQINAYIKEAHKMSQIYSDLHQTIQDKFNEAGIRDYVSALHGCP